MGNQINLTDHIVSEFNFALLQETLDHELEHTLLLPWRQAQKYTEPQNVQEFVDLKIRPLQQKLVVGVLESCARLQDQLSDNVNINVNEATNKECESILSAENIMCDYPVHGFSDRPYRTCSIPIPTRSTTTTIVD